MPDRDIRAVLEARARLTAGIRAFFAERGVLEVETPVVLAANAPEANIEAVRAGRGWMRTSPELHMKRLVAAGSGAIYQMGPCGRAGERGRIHREEFTLLEWYRPGGDELTVMEDLAGLMESLAREFWGGAMERDFGGGRRLRADVGSWERIGVGEAFRRWAGWDPTEAWDADRFDLDLVEKVEPRLDPGRPTVLEGYPAAAAALAEKAPGGKTARRWEMYWGGVELANAFYELRDPAEQRARFEEENRERVKKGLDAYPLDEAFLSELGKMPPTGGIAVGVDRLLMVLTGAAELGEVLAF